MRFKLMKVSNICPRHFSVCPTSTEWVWKLNWERESESWGSVANVWNKGTSSDHYIMNQHSYIYTQKTEQETCVPHTPNKPPFTGIELLNLLLCASIHGLLIQSNHVVHMEMQLCFRLVGRLIVQTAIMLSYSECMAYVEYTLYSSGSLVFR